ncbi:uncharacterized protein CLUP02_05306 [Colletotrichum lupini]|uniref:Uncharacterized protein n=1 Tax=Colletotrichum lupini TaxID=145971 RepID=A0A9Q8SN25_9PEZI|nr:uncharacterized protein CLUP02_05306 [Colletotrichum lupini]UQC79826.1 hypothetical protein CLUP02_05306 [Colletotrichum lupini]
MSFHIESRYARLKIRPFLLQRAPVLPVNLAELTETHCGRAIITLGTPQVSPDYGRLASTQFTQLTQARRSPAVSLCARGNADAVATVSFANGADVRKPLDENNGMSQEPGKPLACADYIALWTLSGVCISEQEQAHGRDQDRNSLSDIASCSRSATRPSDFTQRTDLDPLSLHILHYNIRQSTRVGSPESRIFRQEGFSFPTGTVPYSEGEGGREQKNNKLIKGSVVPTATSGAQPAACQATANRACQPTNQTSPAPEGEKGTAICCPLTHKIGTVVLLIAADLQLFSFKVGSLNKWFILLTEQGILSPGCSCGTEPSSPPYGGGKGSSVPGGSKAIHLIHSLGRSGKADESAFSKSSSTSGWTPGESGMMMWFRLHSSDLFNGAAEFPQFRRVVVIIHSPWAHGGLSQETFSETQVASFRFSPVPFPVHQSLSHSRGRGTTSGGSGFPDIQCSDLNMTRIHSILSAIHQMTREDCIWRLLIFECKCGSSSSFFQASSPFPLLGRRAPSFFLFFFSSPPQYRRAVDWSPNASLTPAAGVPRLGWFGQHSFRGKGKGSTLNTGGKHASILRVQTLCLICPSRPGVGAQQGIQLRSSRRKTLYLEKISGNKNPRHLQTGNPPESYYSERTSTFLQFRVTRGGFCGHSEMRKHVEEKMRELLLVSQVLNNKNQNGAFIVEF